MKRILILLVAACLTACSTSILAPVTKEVHSNDDNAAKLLRQAQHGDGAVGETRKSSIEYVNSLWLPTSKEEKLKSKNDSKITLARPFSMDREFNNIQELAERITYLTGIPVSIAADVVPVSQQAIQGKSTVPAAAPTAATTLPTPMSAIRTNGAQAQTPVAFTYTGTFGGFMDLAAARYDVSWDISDNRISFFRNMTKTFQIFALPGDTAMQALVTNQSGNGSSSGSTSGTSGSTTGSTTSASTTTGSATSSTGISYSGLSVWTAITDSIKSMLSKTGTVVSAAATGSVTVTDTPQILERIESFIAAQNENLSRQVVVNVKVLSVDLNDSDDYGINLNTLYSSLNGNFGFGLSNAYTTGTGDSNLALKVLGTAGTGVSGNAPIKAWQGTSAILSALSQQGHVSQVTSAALMTLNQQAAPLQVGSQTAYLQSSATTITATVGSTTTLTPGMFTTGFSMSIVPNILDKTRLLLQYNINISSLIQLSTVSSNGNSIQTPNIATRNFLQRVMLNSGDTLVMTGFEQTSLSSNAQGVGNPNNLALGGGANGSKTRSVLVILIQPILGDQ